MSLITTRPDSGIANGDSNVNGAASRWEALADDSDTSYVTLHDPGTSYTSIGFAEPTIPAGAILLTQSLRVRVSDPGSAQFNGQLGVILNPVNVSRVYNLGWDTPVTFTLIADEPIAEGAGYYSVSMWKGGGAAHDDVQVFALYIDTRVVVVPVTNVTAPTGTVTDTTLPTVTWSNTLDSDGGVQTGYEVRVVTGTDPDANIVVQSGVRTGPASSWTLTTSLVDNTYRAYVRVKQTVEGEAHWSDWNYEAFTIDVDCPADPTISATADNTNGRIELTVAGSGGGAATTDYLEVQRSVAGAAWEYVRAPQTDGLIDAAAIPADYADYEAPNGTSVTYRARALHEYAVGDLAASAWVSSSAATWTSDDCWLKHPTDPALNLKLPFGRVTSYPGRAKPARQGVFQALGAASPVVISDTRGGITGKLGVRLDTLAEQASLDALLDTVAPLLVQVRAEDLEADRWVAVGDADRNRVVDKSWVESAVEELGWTEVPRPAGAITDWPAL